MDVLVCSGDIALDQVILWLESLVFMKVAEELRWAIRDLGVHSFKVYGAVVKSGWGAGPQTVDGKP